MPHLLLALGTALTLASADPQNPAPGQGPAPAQPKVAAPSAVDLVGALESTLIDAIARAEPSVVAISRLKGDGERTQAVRGRQADKPAGAGLAAGPGSRPFDPRLLGVDPDEIDTPQFLSSDYGSGVVIGPGNEILTAFSVVQGASQIIVGAKGAGYFEAEVIAADPRTDLAVIVPRPNSGRKLAELPPVALGDATKLRKGSFLLALGNPFNAAQDGRASAAWGILANTRRRLDSSALTAVDPNRKQLRHYPTLLQLDSKLNLGMTGGAVLNLRGELVGLTTDAANVGGFDAQSGYAMPIDALARRAIDLLRQGREVEYGFLGVSLLTNSGRINSVSPGTPASEADFRPNDQIVAVGEFAVTDADSLILAVNAYSPGAPIEVKIRRGGEEMVRSVNLAKLPISGEVIATNRPEPWRGLRVDYLSLNARANAFVRNPGFEFAEAKAPGGVIVVEVQAGSPGDDAELKVGQIIHAVDGEPVRTPVDFARVVGKKRGAVRLTVEGNQTVVVP